MWMHSLVGTNQKYRFPEIKSTVHLSSVTIERNWRWVTCSIKRNHALHNSPETLSRNFCVLTCCLFFQKPTNDETNKPNWILNFSQWCYLFSIVCLFCCIPLSSFYENCAIIPIINRYLTWNRRSYLPNGYHLFSPASYFISSMQDLFFWWCSAINFCIAAKLFSFVFNKFSASKWP